MVFTSAVLLGLVAGANAYWLMGVENFITTERIDPIVSPSHIASHVHSVLGGSNFRMSVSTAGLRQSSCTSIPIPEDKSNYWFPHLYFQWKNGSFTSLNGGAVIYYLFSDTPGTTTAFPEDFRMISGDMTLRSYDPKSPAQQAVSFLCLDFNGVTTKHTGLPKKPCPSGIRAQINFPSCWDGKNVDSADHKSHVGFPSGGPDSGTCSDKRYPVTIPRIFLELYWGSNVFDSLRNQAMDSKQPFVFAQGDPTGYGYHADFVNGWDAGVLQKAVDHCTCSQYGDPTCCAEKRIFTLTRGKQCHLTHAIDETTTGTLSKLPGNNPVVGEGKPAPMLRDSAPPALISPVYVYTGDKPTAIGTIVPSPTNNPQSINPTASSTGSPTAASPTASSASPPSSRPTRTPAKPRSEAEVLDTRSPNSDNISQKQPLEAHKEEPFSAKGDASRLTRRRYQNHAIVKHHNAHATNF